MVKREYDAKLEGVSVLPHMGVLSHPIQRTKYIRSETKQHQACMTFVRSLFPKGGMVSKITHRSIAL